MSFVLKLRRKKKEAPAKRKTWEDAINAAGKRTMLETRYEENDRLNITTTDEKGNKVNVAAGEVAKSTFKTTQALGEIGDRYRISKKAAKGWKKLLGDYHDSEVNNGPKHPMTKALESLVFEARLNLVNRSLRREHTDVEIVIPPPGLLQSGYGYRAERTSTLEK